MKKRIFAQGLVAALVATAFAVPALAWEPTKTVEFIEAGGPWYMRRPPWRPAPSPRSTT